jgi:SAM-dependent methyltransferase
MTANPSAADWAAARGEKWRAHLDGMEATLRAVDEPLIRALRLDAPGRIADLGCGGGDTTRAILRGAPAGSAVHGYDIAPGLIELARARSNGIEFEVANVATATPRAPYDRIASRFGVMFFDEPLAAFTNLRRWLVPGGRFAFAVWGPAADNAWFLRVREVVAAIVAMPRPEPDAPGPFRYGEIATLLSLLERAGFADVAVQDWRGALPVGGGMPPDAAAAFALAAHSSFGELLAAAGGDAVREAQRAVAERFAQRQRDGAVWMDASVRIVTGMRPRDSR